MAILIKATESKKITILGTDIEINEVYGRVRFLGGYNGKTIEAEVTTFSNKSTFVESKILYTDIPMGNFKVDVLEDESQSIEVAHKYAKMAYEQMGYEVEVSL